jgi:uncharacterized protein involved in type VI secretion and phage assembly
MPLSKIDTFFEQLQLYGLEHFKKYYGIYRATVTAVNDPDMRGRIQAMCPAVGHTMAPNVWISPAFDGAGGNDRGSFLPPDVGDLVRISFEAGDPGKPILYIGGWYPSNTLPAEFGYDSNGNPAMRGWIFRNGHQLTFDGTAGSENISLVWRAPTSAPSGNDSSDRSSSTPNSSLMFNSDGSIVITNKNMTSINMDATGKQVVITDQDNMNTITMDSSGVTIATNNQTITLTGMTVNANSTMVALTSAASQPAVLGQALSTWLMTHTHGTGVGPSTPPLVPPPPTILSEVVTLS